jgi:trk system potassium uptake protein TrkH
MYLSNAEMPGNNNGKIVANTKRMLMYLYSIYFSLTILEIILLCIGKVSFFNSVLISMSTISTGGLTFMNDSLASLSSYSKCVVCLFMFLSGVNFNLYFLLIVKRFKSVFKSEELKVYLFMTIISVLFIFFNTYSLYSSIKTGALNSMFHTVSIMTSTGFSISNINIYPSSCRVLFLFLMLVSACGGSTCGGFKISRLILAVKTMKRDLLKVIHPNSIHVIKYDGKIASDELINSNNTFLFLYVGFIVIIMFIVSLNGFDYDVTLNSVFSTFANTGLCFNVSNYAHFSDLSKIALSIGMLLGRLEIFPLIVLFSDLRK